MVPEPEVVFEDNHLFICLKPAGMPVQSDATQDLCLVDWAKAYLVEKYKKQGDAFVGLVHRLDRPVSGLVILTKTSKALARMNQAVAERAITKKYLARVEKTPSPEADTLVDYLQKNSENNTSRRVSPKHPHGKRAELSYKVLATDDLHALLGINLQTGRHHQIRVQLSTRGWPIVGDLKYGAKETYTPNAIQLHAAYLSFLHPITQTKIVLEKPPVWAPNAPSLSY
jgi:23S rRNA pseudouridine1911/1915/1917 synthase